MASIVTSFEDIANDQRNVEGLAEIVRNRVFTKDLNEMFSVVEGVKGGQQIAAVSSGEYSLKADPGCDPTRTSLDIPTFTDRWNPKRQWLGIELCFDKFNTTFMQWKLANGAKVADLSEAEGMVMFLEDYISETIVLDTKRLALLGYETIGDDDILTDEAGKLAYYNNIEKGLIAKLLELQSISEFSGNFIDLDKNDGANDAANLALAEGYAKDIFEQLVDMSDYENNIMLTSNSMYSNYRQYFRDYAAVQSSKDDIQKGIRNLQIDGVNIVNERNYDRWRKADFKADLGAGAYLTHLPHFAVYAKKEHLQLGVDSVASMTDLEMFYDKKSRNFIIDASFMLDFKISNPYEVYAAI